MSNRITTHINHPVQFHPQHNFNITNSKHKITKDYSSGSPYVSSQEYQTTHAETDIQDLKGMMKHFLISQQEIKQEMKVIMKNLNFRQIRSEQ